MNSPESLRVLATRSPFNPTLAVWVIVVTLTLVAGSTDSQFIAILWPSLLLIIWIGLETAAVTVFLHRGLTHGPWDFVSAAYVRFWLWWARAGQVKFWEWVENHASHHYYTDTNRDSYTPQVYIDRIGMPPLRRPNPFRIFDNARSYTRTSEYFRAHPEELDQLEQLSPDVAAARERLRALKWAREEYGNTSTALKDTLLLFLISALPLSSRLPLVLGLPAALFLAWLMIGIKVYLYLLGGYIINYFGHLAEQAPHQSDIPRWLRWITLWLLGEAWHQFHHDAPYSARFHPYFDPGWWIIRASKALGLVKNVVVAEKIGHRQYRPVRIP